MRRRACPSYRLENLECRLALSASVASAALGGAAAATDPTVDTRRYRIDSFLAGDSSIYGNSWSNPAYTQAQQFFDRFHDIFPKYQTTNPNPPPPPTPTPPPAPGDPVTITQDPKGSLTRLTITGATSNDSIIVSQSGSTLTIIANGITNTVSGNFAEIAIYGGAATNNITVQSSVNITTLLYGGAGTNILKALGSAQSYIVTVGGGTNTVTGNGLDTSYWVNPADTVNASAAEIAAGDVHRIASFYQPFSTDPTSPLYIPTTRNGQTLPEPTDSGTTIAVNDSLWGAGPTFYDVNQGQVGDCYFLASIQSLAAMEPGVLQQMAVDLGDGTFAVQFKRGTTTTYVRVDDQLPVASWGGLLYAHPLNDGPMWAAIMEKAYAYFRTGANTYASLNWGWTGSAFYDLGIATTTFTPAASNTFSALTTAVTNSKPIAAITNSTITGGAPVIGSHAYTVLSTSTIGGVQYVIVRNPWGVDGAGSDSNPNDGIVTLTLAQFEANFASGSIVI